MRSYGMPMPPREKRTAKVQSYVPQSLREFYEQQVKPPKSLSDVVYEALEEHAAVQIAKQKISGRAGRQ